MSRVSKDDLPVLIERYLTREMCLVRGNAALAAQHLVDGDIEAAITSLQMATWRASVAQSIEALRLVAEASAFDDVSDIAAQIEAVATAPAPTGDTPVLALIEALLRAARDARRLGVGNPETEVSARDVLTVLEMDPRERRRAGR